MGSVLRNLIYSTSRVQTVIKGKRGVVLVARINLGEFERRDNAITKGSYLSPSSLLSFTPTMHGIIQLKLT